MTIKSANKEFSLPVPLLSQKLKPASSNPRPKSGLLRIGKRAEVSLDLPKKH
jgi:hypothetical protein